MTSIHPSAIVHEGAQLGAGVEIGPYSIVGAEVKLGDRTRVMPHAFLDGQTTLGSDCVVYPFASIGTQSQDRKFKGCSTFVEIGDRTTLREYVSVHSGTREGEITRVGADCLILAYCHVAHGCKVGNRVTMANASALSGEVVVEDEAVLGGMTGIPAESVAHVKKAYRLLYREGLSTRQAVERIRAEVPSCAEIVHLLSFIEASERGIVK